MSSSLSAMLILPFMRNHIEYRLRIGYEDNIDKMGMVQAGRRTAHASPARLNAAVYLAASPRSPVRSTLDTSQQPVVALVVLTMRVDRAAIG